MVVKRNSVAAGLENNQEEINKGKALQRKILGIKENDGENCNIDVMGTIQLRLNTKWMAALFCNVKFVNSQLLKDETTTSSIMNKAFEACGYDTAELKSKSRQPIKDFIREKINRCRHFYVENIKKSIVDDNGCGKNTSCDCLTQEAWGPLLTGQELFLQFNRKLPIWHGSKQGPQRDD